MDRLAIWIAEHLPARLLAVACFVVHWCSAGVVLARTSEGRAPTVTQESIHVSLPVYVTSIIATAVFTWTVAKYDHARSKRLDELERKLSTLVQGRERQP